MLHRNPTPLRRGKDLNPLSVGLGQLELGSTVTTDRSSSVLALKLNRAKEGFPKYKDAIYNKTRFAKLEISQILATHNVNQLIADSIYK